MSLFFGSKQSESNSEQWQDLNGSRVQVISSKIHYVLEFAMLSAYKSALHAFKLKKKS